MTTRLDILRTAGDFITKDRHAAHGNAEDSFANIAGGWSWWLSMRPQRTSTVGLDAYDVAAMMQLFKIARMATNPGHIDSAYDNCGYGAIMGEIGQSRAGGVNSEANGTDVSDEMFQEMLASARRSRT